MAATHFCHLRRRLGEEHPSILPTVGADEQTESRRLLEATQLRKMNIPGRSAQGRCLLLPIAPREDRQTTLWSVSTMSRPKMESRGFECVRLSSTRATTRTMSTTTSPSSDSVKSSSFRLTSCQPACLPVYLPTTTTARPL